MIGTDFETFMRVDDTLIPIPGHLDIGDKHGQHVQLSNGTMHRDNVMVELCPNAVESVDDMVGNVQSLISEAEEYLSKALEAPVSLALEPSVQFSKAQLLDRNAREMGCDQDFLARTGDSLARMPLRAGILGTTRCAGGHIHLSYGAEQIPEPVAVHMADLTLGALEVAFGTQGARRQYYGLPGLFRSKTYGDVRGIEYRTVSNLWLQTKERIQSMITNALSLEALLRTEKPEALEQFIMGHWPAFMDQHVLEDEKAPEAAQTVAAVQDAFPNYDWRLGA